MKIPLSWLSEYVDITGISIEDFCHKMTMSGSIVEGHETLFDGISGVVTGRILTVEPHPNADKLSVCKVNIGTRPSDGATKCGCSTCSDGDTVQIITIVTAAKNVAAGQIVPVALDGATLHGGMVISDTDMRGVTSQGMFCSYQELGMDVRLVPGAPSDGIMILSDLDILSDETLGVDVLTAIGLRETVVEFEITPNRPDCMSVVGIAREAAATFERPLTLPVAKKTGGGGDASALLSVAIEAPELCRVYCGRVVKDVKIAPSPWLYRKRLYACGLRPINNVVDITNYVMLLYGQPMHAFDYACLSDGKIVVRRARDGEVITTLDGSDRPLSPDMLVIADAHSPSAVAGVMGGLKSEVTDSTRTIVFESACFNGDSVRSTSGALCMRTDSSALFEKCLTPAHVLDAADTACELAELFRAGTVCDGRVVAGSAETEPVKVPVDAGKINRLLGTDFVQNDVFALLERLGFGRDGDCAIVPPWRGDIAMLADLAEEAARIYGYDNLPTTMAEGVAKNAGYSARQKSEIQIASLARSLGYSEILTYSFVSPAYFDKLCIADDSPLRNYLKIINPMGEDTSVMRTSALGAAIQAASRNRAARVGTARLYELAKVFIPTGGALPSEEKRLALCAYGDVDFYGFKGDIEAILSGMRIDGVRFRRLADDALFHPGRAAVIEANGMVIGRMGELHPVAAEGYDLDLPVYAAELDFELIYANIGPEPLYKPVPRFPSSSRDLAVVVGSDVAAGDLCDCISASGGDILDSVGIFDVYTGGQVEAGHKSVAFALSFRADDRTLKDTEVDAAMSAIVTALASEYNAKVRG